MPDDAKRWLESNATILGGYATVLTLVGTVFFFVFNLYDRVVLLEQQVHTLTVAPTIAATVGSKDGPVLQTVPNPVAQSCADLAKRAADEAGRGSVLVSQQMERMMSNLQCGQGAKN